jgi:serine/threonine protein kinase
MEKYDVQKLLGKGSFGSVYQARRIVDNAMLVMKKVNIGDLPQKEKDAAMLEVKVLQRMHHPAIVGLENSFVFKNRQLCIVMELCEGGDMAQYLAKKTPGKQFLPEDLVLDWFLQVCLAIQYMHEQKIMHRDIKSQNVFLTKDNRVKLGDFGIAKVLAGTNQMAKTVIGTPYYMSPEQFRNQPYSFKSDVWSLGCLLYEMCCLRHAFEARDMDGLVKKIMRCSYSALPSTYSPGVQNLVKALLQLAPARRPSVSEILAMPVLRERMRV